MNTQDKHVFIRLVIVVVLLSLTLTAMIVSRQSILNTGEVIVLETRPIDPRSLFRGDYVRLNYLINELHLDEIEGDSAFMKNDSIYVVVEEDQNNPPFWKPVAAYSSPPQNLKQGQIYMHGVVDWMDTRRWNTEKEDFEDIVQVSVLYGIENYFVPEGEGLKLERPETGDEVTLEIAVDDQGRSAIKRLLLNGQALYQESLF